MTPEEIRRVFAEQADDQSKVERGIYCALRKLDLLVAPDKKAASPYSISRLTQGLPNREAIITLALKKRAEWQRSRGGGGGNSRGFTLHAPPETFLSHRISVGQTVP